MATIAKDQSSGSRMPAVRGVRIFTYPKTIFVIPTLIASIISAIIMLVSGNITLDPGKAAKREVQAQAVAAAEVQTPAQPAAEGATVPTTNRRFTRPQNLAGLLFLTVLFLNLIVMSIDFPRFTIIAVVLGAVALIFLALYLNVYFNILPPLVDFMDNLYTVANAQFYVVVATMLLLVLGVIWVTRYLDYWVILPNEILHNHGPFSDLERYPTTNLKLDKEIPDIMEYALLGSGRLVLHIYGQPMAFSLDNVLWIDRKESQLKEIMSRLEVRVTTDQETRNLTG